MVYKQPRAGAGERCTKRQAERNSSGCGGGEHTVIFLVLKASRKVNMNLKDKLIYSLPIPEISKGFYTTHIRQQDSFNKK